MRIIIIILFLIVTYSAHSQELSNMDLLVLSADLPIENKERDSHREFRQFLDNCIYQEKCGVFLQNSMHEFGFLKGTILSIDRRLRCTSLNKSETSSHRFNSAGFIEDYAKDYRFSDH